MSPYAKIYEKGFHKSKLKMSYRSASSRFGVTQLNSEVVRGIMYILKRDTGNRVKH
jgi:hypothetical protein